MNFIKIIFKKKQHKKELEERYSDAWFNLEAQSGVIYGSENATSDPDGNFYDAAYTNQIAKK